MWALQEYLASSSYTGTVLNTYRRVMMLSIPDSPLPSAISTTSMERQMWQKLHGCWESIKNTSQDVVFSFSYSPPQSPFYSVSIFKNHYVQLRKRHVCKRIVMLNLDPRKIRSPRNEYFRTTAKYLDLPWKIVPPWMSASVPTVPSWKATYLTCADCE